MGALLAVGLMDVATVLLLGEDEVVMIWFQQKQKINHNARMQYKTVRTTTRVTIDSVVADFCSLLAPILPLLPTTVSFNLYPLNSI